jgi:hypothetical protein
MKDRKRERGEGKRGPLKREPTLFLSSEVAEFVD